MLFTIVCGVLFLAVKLGYEYPAKFNHFGAYIKESALPKYEAFLGNTHLASRGLEPRIEITGHLENKEALTNPGIKDYEIQVDEINADPSSPENDRPRFWPRPLSDKIAKVAKEDVEFSSMFVPRHSSFFATYFTITGLHGLHVLAGVLVFCYYLLPVSTALYRKDPEHFANRVEVAGLFWHFVDLVWIFVFPIFYLL
jgi:cytochrome c oxidase subunit 3